VPTAHEYRTAASRYRDLAEVLVSRSTSLGGWPLGDQLGAGPAFDAAAEGLTVSARHLRTAADGASALARECDRRAEVCDEHRRRLASHAALDPEVRLIIPRPLPPFPWVE
jgi:hypothetical protein